MNQIESVQKVLDVLSSITRENDMQHSSLASIRAKVDDNIVKVTHGWFSTNQIEKMIAEFDHVTFSDGQLWMWYD